MRDELPNNLSGGVNVLVGAGTGALAGAVLRLLVGLRFVYYVSRWGGSWWSGVAGFGYWLCAIPAVIGFVIGGAAGATCRPILGSLLGAGLSALSCAGLFVLPSQLLIRASNRSPSECQEQLTAAVIALAAMTLAGALAGGIGAFAGKHTRKRAY